MGIDPIVECERAALLGGVAQAVDEIAPPEGFGALLGVDPSGAVDDPVVGSLGPVEDVGVALHGLEEEFDALDGGHEGFGEGADETAEEEVGEELGEAGGWGRGGCGGCGF